jgi:hypothetical protein
MSSKADRVSSGPQPIQYVYQTEEIVPDRNDPTMVRRVVTTNYRAYRPLVPPTCEHDMARGLLALTYPDGTVEHFRDKPTRYLVVEPDRDTGALRPIMVGSKAQYLYLCREEREVVGS